MVDTVSPPATIADAKRQATVDRILTAACRLLIERGLDVTMDEIAAEAGVSRRTLFRHFDTRERLVAEGLAVGIDRYGERLPSFTGDWRGWLADMCRTAHRMQASYGPGYWELTSRGDLPPEIAAVEARRRVRRREAMERIARKLWREAGGQGEAPPTILATVGGHLSARFTAAVTTDAGQGWEVAAQLAYLAISQLVTAELAEQT
jgi:AcrR family transcriptional regulator